MSIDSFGSSANPLCRPLNVLTLIVAALIEVCFLLPFGFHVSVGVRRTKAQIWVDGHAVVFALSPKPSLFESPLEKQFFYDSFDGKLILACLTC